MQQVELALFVEIAGENQLSSLTKFRHPRAVSGAKLFFELLSKFLGQRRTLPGGRNRNLQISAAHYRGIEEIAEVGNIDHIAEHVPSLRFVIGALVQAARIRG